MTKKFYPTVFKGQFFGVLSRFAADERGATAIEYALVAMLTTILAIGAMTALGDVVTTKFFDVIASLIPGSS